LLEKIALLVEQIEQVNEKEKANAKEETSRPPRDNNENNSSLESKSKDTIEDSESLKKTIARMNEQLKEELSKSKRLKNKVNKLENDYLAKLSEYEKHEQILDGRSSYSKATMFRLAHQTNSFSTILFIKMRQTFLFLFLTWNRQHNFLKQLTNLYPND